MPLYEETKPNNSQKKRMCQSIRQKVLRERERKNRQWVGGGKGSRKR